MNKGVILYRSYEIANLDRYIICPEGRSRKGCFGWRSKLSLAYEDYIRHRYLIDVDEWGEIVLVIPMELMT